MNDPRTAAAILAIGGLLGVGLLLSACPGEDTALGAPDTGAPTATPVPTPAPTPTTADGGPKTKTSCLDRPPGSAPLPGAPTTGLPCELIPPGLVLK